MDVIPAAIEIHIAVAGSELAAETKAGTVIVNPRTMSTEPRTKATVLNSRNNARPGDRRVLVMP
jgi:hypothetical protein